MKTLVCTLGVLVLVGFGVSWIHPSVHAANVSVSVGRYAITHLDGERALMVDTATGAVWQYAFGDYCQSKTPQHDFRLDFRSKARRLPLRRLHRKRRVRTGLAEADHV